MDRFNALEPLENRVMFSAHPVSGATPAEVTQHSGFVSVIDNPYLPLTPGAKFLYTGHSSDGFQKNLTTVISSYTKTIKGVICTVVLDRVFVDGELIERTHDYFAQDTQGNVWYFGEDSKEIDNGQVVSTDGSFRHGVNGAKAGIIMKANPMVNDAYFQENAPPEAIDQARVLSLTAGAKTPLNDYLGCLKTEEFTALEPEVTEHKFYKPGIGLVKSQSVRGEVDKLALVRVTGL